MSVLFLLRAGAGRWMCDSMNPALPAPTKRLRKRGKHDELPDETTAVKERLESEDEPHASMRELVLAFLKVGGALYAVAPVVISVVIQAFWKLARSAITNPRGDLLRDRKPNSRFSMKSPIEFVRIHL